MPSNSPTLENRDTEAHTGCLYVVATPIGNLEDITLRALKILGSVDLIAAEDTRRTGRLLAHHRISSPLTAYHEHNEAERTPGLVQKMAEGHSVALVTDAGTPSISDPGYRLVKAAAERGVRVTPVPGASAAVAALSVSGLPTDAFVFIGFAARKRGKRRRQLASLAAEPKTLIFYESPKRVVSFLRDAAAVFGERHVVLVRELTKLHEEILRGRVSEMLRILDARAELKGECVLVVSGAEDAAPAPTASLETLIREALETSDAGPSVMARQIAEQIDLPRSRVYEAVLRVKAQKDAGR